MRTSIGLKDRDGRDICEGDMVEYWVDYDSEGQPTYDGPSATKMVDLVCVINQPDPVAYFVDWIETKKLDHSGNQDIAIDGRTYCGAFAWRHAAHCRVIASKGVIPAPDEGKKL